MNRIRFVDGVPVTGIELLDERIRVEGFSYCNNSRMIRVDFMYNNEEYCAMLYIDFINIICLT